MTVKLPTGVAPEYEKFIIKEYQYWTLLLHEDQRYLGRSYIWLRRPGKMQSFFELFPQEEFERSRIGASYETVIRKLWQADLFNDVWLGNEIRSHGGHGHMHFIPRYHNKREFAGVTFVDQRFRRGREKNYSPYKKFRPKEEVLFKIRDAIREII